MYKCQVVSSGVLIEGEICEQLNICIVILEKFITPCHRKTLYFCNTKRNTSVAQCRTAEPSVS